MQQQITTVAVRWRAEVLEWSDTWPKAGMVLPSGRRRNRYLLLRAVLGLAQRALADGALRPREGTPWSLTQLSGDMSTTVKTARDICDWLESTGWLACRKGSWTGDGRTADARWLTIREESIVEVPDGTQPGMSTLVDKPAANGNSMGEESASHGGITGKPSGNAEIVEDHSSLSSLVSLHSLDSNNNPDVTNGLDTSKQRKETARRWKELGEEKFGRDSDAAVQEVAS